MLKRLRHSVKDKNQMDVEGNTVLFARKEIVLSQEKLVNTASTYYFVLPSVPCVLSLH